MYHRPSVSKSSDFVVVANHVAALEAVSRSAEGKILPSDEKSPRPRVLGPLESSSEVRDYKALLKAYCNAKGIRLVKGDVPKLKSKRSSKNNQHKAAPEVPPEIQVTPMVSQTLRFIFDSGYTGFITVKGLSGALGGICSVVNSTLKHWTSSFRLKRVSIWVSAIDGGSAPHKAEVQWVDEESGRVPDFEWDASLPSGITTDSGVHSKPPSGSIASRWIDVVLNAADDLFHLNVSTKAIMDIEVEYTLSNLLGTTTTSITTGTLGSVYYLPLDRDQGSSSISQGALPSTA